MTQTLKDLKDALDLLASMRKACIDSPVGWSKCYNAGEYLMRRRIKLEARKAA